MTTQKSALHIVPVRVASALPHYELRAKRELGSDMSLEIWQLPASATPHIKQPAYVAGLHGRNLSLVEHRLLRRLKALRIHLTDLPAIDALRVPIDEELAINLGLLFRALAPMRNRENMAAVAAGIEAMSREEAGYWLGMAMHRKHPRRVLMALRFLLIDPTP
jgi:predicted component of type VI protein secretion system